MVVHKRKKNTRQHGSKTHGWGSMKKHRGHGHRGGSGMAGTGKKGDAKKPSIWKDTEYFGGHGFKSKSRTISKSVPLQYLDEHAKELSTSGKAPFDINVKSMGYTKVLGTGKVKNKLNITADFFTPSAISKIEAAGGSVTATGVKKEKKAKKAAE